MSAKSRSLWVVAVALAVACVAALLVLTHGKSDLTASGLLSPAPSAPAEQPAGPAKAVPPVSTPRPEPLPVLGAKEAAKPAAPGTPGAPPVKGGCLKGVGTWDLAQGQKALKDSGSCWFYTWSPKNWFGSPAGVQFVPMIWSGKDIGEVGNVQGPTLLGFNEPDLGGQANMSVEEALTLWPKLMGTGKRLGSPAPAWGGDLRGGWLDRFMQGAAERRYRVDFIALHWYGADFTTSKAVTSLREYLQRVQARWHKPIWLTEFALINHSNGAMYYPPQAQTTAFVKAATRMLEGLPYVERYAYFALPATRGNGTGLFNDGARPTDAGRAFQAARRTR
ncbi:MAG: glycoside hydrolase family protein [Streptosporangiaceae bacterium]